MFVASGELCRSSPLASGPSNLGLRDSVSYSNAVERMFVLVSSTFRRVILAVVDRCCDTLLLTIEDLSIESILGNEPLIGFLVHWHRR